MSSEYTWQERFDFILDVFASLWNSALNFVAENYGQRALDKYCKYAFSPNVATFWAISKDLDKEGARALQSTVVSNLKKLGSEISVVKADQDELTIEISKCRTKSMLDAKNRNPKYYCRHCLVAQPIWEALGFRNEARKTGSSSCIRTYRRIGR